MIVYSSRCMACADKALWRKLKAFAAEHNLTIEERRTTKNPEWQQEADNYGVETPFAVNGKIALNLNQPLENLL